MISQLGDLKQWAKVLATGELWLFLLQFPLANLCMCVLFARTAGGPNPLVARLAAEAVALRQPATPHPGLHRFFQRATWLWAGIFLLLAAGLAVMMVAEPATIFLMLSTAVTVALVVAGRGRRLREGCCRRDLALDEVERLIGSANEWVRVVPNTRERRLQVQTDRDEHREHDLLPLLRGRLGRGEDAERGEHATTLDDESGMRGERRVVIVRGRMVVPLAGAALRLGALDRDPTLDGGAEAGDRAFGALGGDRVTEQRHLEQLVLRDTRCRSEALHREAVLGQRQDGAALTNPLAWVPKPYEMISTLPPMPG